MAAENEVHVLMVSMALQGHLNPMLKFAKRLISKGVHVTLATNDLARHRMQKHSAAGSQQNQKIQLEFFSDGLPFDFDRDADTGTFLDYITTVGLKNLSAQITDLTKTQNYSCMIINPFVPWAVSAADEHGMPCAVLWIQACAVYSIYYRYFKKINPFPDLDDPNATVELPALPPLEVRCLPSFMLPSCPPHFTKIIMQFYEALDKVKWVFGTSCYEIEKEIVDSLASLSPIHPIGPLVSPFLLGEKESNPLSVDMWDADNSCMEWLDNQPHSSVIFIAFGSITILSQKQMDNIARALKNSKKSFLWVIKQGENGGAELPIGFLEETEGRGLVVKWCPQERVLMHPAVACFVTHCGWNSTLETVVAGVPVIAYPGWTDQPTNAELLASVLKNGVKMMRSDGVASAEEVERGIRGVMDGPKASEMKKRAQELKEAARKALQEGGSSDMNLNMFVGELQSSKGLSLINEQDKILLREDDRKKNLKAFF